MSKRLSNIELLRIVAMLMVLCLHSNFLSLGYVTEITSTESFVRTLAEQLCIVCVNVFVLISGWFGIRANLKGAFSLLFQVLFYAVLFIVPTVMGGGSASREDLFNLFYFGAAYWFFTAYLILYGLSPILNAFVKHCSRREFVAVLFVFFFFEFTLGWFVDGVATYNNGYSTISFMGLYLLGRFLALHCNGVPKLSAANSISLYLLFTIIPVLLFLLTGDGSSTLDYSSLFVVLASVFFFLTFTKLKFENRGVNYLACSAFSIYLVHQHPLVWPYYKEMMAEAYAGLNGFIFIPVILLFVVVFSVCCMLIDKLRIRFWNYLCVWFVDKWVDRIEAIFGRLCRKMGL